MKDTSLAEILAAATALAFLLTVFYGYGFSMPLGISVFTYFTVNDYFRYSVMWLTPAASLMLAISLLPGILIVKAKDYVLSLPPHGLRSRETYQKLLALAAVMALTNLLTTAFLYPFAGYVRISVLGLIFVIVWYASVKAFYSKQSLQPGASLTGKALLFVPLFLWLAFILGTYHSERSMRVASLNTDTRIILKEQKQLLTGMILLSLDQFLLLRDDDNQQVKVIPQSEIKQIIHDN